MTDPRSAPPPADSPTDSDETKFRPSGSVGAVVSEAGEDSDDATRMRPASTEPEDEATRVAGPSSPGSVPRPADVKGNTADKSSPRSGGSTGQSWGDPAQWAQGDSRELRPGDVVKDRFVLEDVIGKGGMGVVFRARDLRKEEAQDRHPYAALKVLNEHFKRHPESLKALQREARKAQNLAHPNIVTVYDFDRDGANVYMVMELLEGEPLDRLIKQMKGTGLTIGKALPIIRALCGALSYAHEHGVVHSDFKPANAFVTRSGAIKVFDFGIARAAKRQGDLDKGDLDETGGKTLFDPGTLGALTPAYASCEMIDGLEPDPRDDVYALGCVAYELLTGKHPFGGKPATLARDAKLRPNPVRGLTRRQWRGLRRSLAFERSARIASVTKFLEEISPEQRSPALWIGIAAAVLVLGAVAALLVPDYLQQRRVEALTAMVLSGASDSIEQALPEIQALPPDARAAMLLDEGLRSSLIGHFKARIDAATDAARQKYDYPQAEGFIGQLTQLFPDSQVVSQIGEALLARKNDEIKLQSDRFDEFLNKGWLVDRQNAQNISAVLAIIVQIDARHPLIVDPRLPSVYAEQARIALQKPDIELAQSLVAAGLRVAPSDGVLKDLNDRVNRELDVQQRAVRLAQLQRSLPERLSGATTLAAFEAAHDDMSALQILAPADPTLDRLRSRLQELLDGEIQSLVAQRSYDSAQELLARSADLALPDFVERQRLALENARSGSRNGSGAGAASQRDATVAALKSELDALLKAPASPQSDERWDVQVRAQLARLSAWLPPTDAYLVSARHAAATTHLAATRELRSQSRLSEAERSLQQAIAYAPDLDAVVQEQQVLTQLRAQQDLQAREQKRLAELTALKQKLLDQATANEVDEAMASLQELRASLLPADAFLNTAPKAIAGAYVRLAGIAARDGSLASAVTLIERALELDSTNTQSVALLEKYAQSLAAASSSAPAKTTGAAPAAAGTQPGAPSAEPAAAQVTPAAVTPAREGSANPAGSVAATSVPAANTSLCNAGLAGYGTRSRGVCFDALPTGRGPDLVVIPAGGAVARPFAISRYEVSVGEYAAFCQQSQKCRSPGAQADLPATSVAAADAQLYADWLSAATGFVYRLPTDSEWVYAADAPGGSTERNFNCVVEIGGQKIRGFALTNVRSGRPNGWGLYNQIGNAQEWVKAGDGWSARGGAFSDAISQCATTLNRASAGAADAATGFRVLRELK